MNNLEVRLESYCPIPIQLENTLPTELGYVDIEQQALHVKLIVKFDWPVVPEIGSEIGSTALFREVVAVQHSITSFPVVQIFTRPCVFDPREKWFLEATSLDEIFAKSMGFTRLIKLGEEVFSKSEIVNVAHLETKLHFRPEIVPEISKEIQEKIHSAHGFQKRRQSFT